MNDYADALSEARNLLASWRELPTREREAADRDSILNVLVAQKSLPREVHQAIVQAARAGEAFYAELQEQEESEIRRLDAELAPLLKRLAELQTQIDRITREKHGREHRLSTLRQYAEQARGLQALPAERVTTPESAESWLAKLPPPEPPAPAEAFRSLYDL